MSEENIPKIIYHYTTQDGLIGILKESALWATKIHYMNDASELIEPFSIAKTFLTELNQQLDPKSDKDQELQKEIALSILDEIDSWQRVNICLVSFCTDGDLLSQWRGYGVSGSAYAIGFDLEKLVQSIRPHSFELHRCQYYDPAAYRDQINQFVSAFIKQALSKHEKPTDFIGGFIKMAAVMKFKCFEEEEEWRIISWEPISYTDERFNFKPGKSILIPYYSLPFDLSSIVEIIIGPCQNPDLARNATYGIAHRYNLNKVIFGNIKISTIPYRVF